ncbi:MAG TPA: GTPase Era [Saprospiraceae bacterium]|nr:GTPase Era [Saprospiraceae bacterium]HQW25752.1 GTPase Era [Saprospiraceae bacterium]
MAEQKIHRSGFVNILGRPNMGKSTLLNALVGEKMSVITSKPQTTRHRIIGIVSSEDFQIVFSDTPGFIDEPAYRMHQMMNAFISLSFDDADIILFVTDPYEPLSEQHNLLQRIASHNAPVLAIINKMDMVSAEELEARVNELAALLPGIKIHTVSALKGNNVQELMGEIVSSLPEGPEFYPKDQLTDRPERFFVSEIIRGKILELYRDEIPYTCEITIDSFTEGESNAGPITRISANIYTLDERKKSIILGKGGSAIKQLGTEARGEIESFLGKRVFLDLNVKVRDNWRDDEKALKSFGYQN